MYYHIIDVEPRLKTGRLLESMDRVLLSDKHGVEGPSGE